MHHKRIVLATACGLLMLQGCWSSGGSSSSRPAEKVDLSGFEVESATYCDHTVLANCL